MSQFLLKDIVSCELPNIEVMDIGAMIEGEDRYEVLVSQELANVTGFEPNPDKLSELNARTGPYQYFPYFLGDGSKATFHLTRYPGCSSLLEPNPEVINLFTNIGAEPGTGNFSVIETLEVDTVRLDDLQDVANPDYLKIDVQGAELLVMENAPDTLSKVLVIETEVEFVPIYKDQPLFGDIQAYLVTQGFMLHKLVDIAGRSLRPLKLPNTNQAMSQLLWADAVFVRDYTNLSTYSDEDLIRSALIMNDVYLSYDLVHLFLDEYDRRQDTNLSKEFLKALGSHENLQIMFMNQKAPI